MQIITSATVAVVQSAPHRDEGAKDVGSSVDPFYHVGGVLLTEGMVRLSIGPKKQLRQRRGIPAALPLHLYQLFHFFL
jgi:hypothetical protein